MPHLSFIDEADRHGDWHRSPKLASGKTRFGLQMLGFLGQDSLQYQLSLMYISKKAEH